MFMIITEGKYVTPQRNIRVTHYQVSYNEERDKILVKAENMEDLWIPLSVPRLDMKAVKRVGSVWK